MNKSNHLTHSHPASRTIWVVIGGMALAFMAGYINLMMLSLFHVPVSHMSGAVSALSSDLIHQNPGHLRIILGIVLGFFGGACLSGAIIGARSYQPGRRYGVVLMIEGCVLALATSLVHDQMAFALPAAAIACGMQNAMATAYHGLTIRTTHVTGIVTDLGIAVGRLIRHQYVDVWEFALLTCLLVGFLLGGICSVLIEPRLGITAVGLPAPICFVSGAIYFLWRRRIAHRAEQKSAG